MQFLFLRRGRFGHARDRLRRRMHFLREDAGGVDADRFGRERLHPFLLGRFGGRERDVNDLLVSSARVFFVQIEDELPERVIRAGADFFHRELEFVTDLGARVEDFEDEWFAGFGSDRNGAQF